MSQNNSQKPRFPSFPNNPNRGHVEFGQAGYTQQYSFNPTLPSVQSTHDIGKAVTGQPGMYPNTSGMPAGTQQHHQAAMSGSVPSQQQASLIQGQQMARTNAMHMQNVYNYRQPSRTMQSITRPQAVVSQPAQQNPSQFSHVPAAMLQGQHFSSMQHAMMMPPFNIAPNLYPPSQISYVQRPMMNTQQVYPMGNQWNNYNSQAPPSSNGYYQQTIYNNAMPQQMHQPAQPPPQQQQQPQHQQTQQATRERRIISIIDPNTGQDVLENMKTKPAAEEKETDNADPNICAQFATQVAATLGEKSDQSRLPVEESRLMDPESVVCPPDVVPLQNIEVTPINEVADVQNFNELSDIDSAGELADTESLAEVEYIDKQGSICSNESVHVYSTDSEPISINEMAFEVPKSVCTVDSIPHVDVQDSVYEVVPDVAPLVSEGYVETGNVEITDTHPFSEQIPTQEENLKKVEEPKKEVVLEEVSNAVVVEIDKPVVPSASVKEEIKPQESEATEIISGVSQIPERLSDSKKGKAKKKKDINKRGESKEGGDMDAFSLPKEESPIPPPVPVSSVPPPVERIPSPVPIVDSEVLKTIPLPGETSQTHYEQVEVLPTEPATEDSVVSSNIVAEEKENDEEAANVKSNNLKYSYKEDQWSPLNPEGKKQYDRDFLIQLQSQPMSLTKPTNLPNLDVIKDKAHIQKIGEIGRAQVPSMNTPSSRFDFLPTFARGSVPRVQHPAAGGRRREQPRDKIPKKIITFSSLSKDVKLHESENAWKPLAKLETSSAVGAEQSERDKLKRSVQGVLNKLTPQKFETLVQQLRNLNIDTEEKLNVVIDLIFEKAIDEPNFSVPYANLCQHLAQIKVPLVGQSGDVNFRKLLLTKCQREFELDRSEELKNEERLQAMEMADPGKKKELKLELEEDEKKIRYRQLGNIRFIGELFKLGMLIEPIMHECIKKLLSQGDEESLECLCKLLKTIGKELDEKKSTKNRDPTCSMDHYFKEMQQRVDDRSTSSRVRFMLQDVIDLKKCRWVPRRDENIPKTIDQIHKEAEREAREQQQVLSNMGNNYGKRMPDDRDRRKPSGRNMGISEDGWTSSTKSNKGSYNSVDPSKLKLTKPDEVESIRLGPMGRGPQSWGRGSSGGNKTSEAEKTVVANRYSALAEPQVSSGYEGRRNSQRSAASSRESSRGRNSGQLPSIRKNASSSKERENLLETVKGFAAKSSSVETKAPEAKQGQDVQLNGKPTETAELGLRGPEYSEEQMEKKTKPLIDEFLHNNNDFEEAIKCVMELVSPSTIQFFINSAVNQVLERSSQARSSLGQLLYSLVKKKIMTFEQYKKGFSIVLEMMDDYALDIPLIWEYIGEILEPMLEDKDFPLAFLKNILLPCIPSETAGLLVSAVLHCSAKKQGNVKLGELWRDSGLQWSDFLGNDSNVETFIKKQKLEFTICPSKAKPISQIPPIEIKKQLSNLLQKTVENEEIFDWIDANVSENTDSHFIRALVSAVLQNVITGTDSCYDLNQSKLKNRIPLLTRYVGKNENSELQALYSIQALMHELDQSSKENLNGYTADQSSKGSLYETRVLRTIFDTLYDDDVITEETFKRWQQNEDPAETEGKASALLSVSSFFTWLRESDDENWG